jgi:hypothetical protein
MGGRLMMNIGSKVVADQHKVGAPSLPLGGLNVQLNIMHCSRVMGKKADKSLALSDRNIVTIDNAKITEEVISSFGEFFQWLNREVERKLPEHDPIVAFAGTGGEPVMMQSLDHVYLGLTRMMRMRKGKRTLLVALLSADAIHRLSELKTCHVAKQLARCGCLARCRAGRRRRY